jgi:O-antigen ligase/tetratricopeptide (TPR) repeat protein
LSGPRATRGSKPATAVARDMSESKLRRFGVALLCAKVALVPLVFDVAQDMPFVVSKALLSHGLAYVLAATMVGLLIQFRSAFVVRSPLHVPVVAFLLVSCASTLVAADRTLALYGTHARMLGLASILDLVVFYFAIVLLVRTRWDAMAVGISTLAASLPVLGYELIQVVGKDPFRWSIESVARPFSTLGQATALAQYLTVLALAAFVCGIFVERVPSAVRGILVALSALLLMGSAATGTRSALVGLVTGSLVLVLLVWRAHSSRRARVFSALGAAVGIGALAAILLFTPLGARLAATIESPPSLDDEEGLTRLEPSTVGRLALYAIGLDMLRERPLLGYGPDNFTVGVPRYRPEAAPQLVRQNVVTSAHSWVIHVATSSGLFGLACFVAVVLLAFGLALRSGLHPGAFAGAAMLGAFLGTGLTTVNEFGTEWLFWLSVGVVAASDAAVARSSGSPSASLSQTAKSRPARRLSNVTQVAVLLLLAVATLTALNGATAFGASRSARGSQEARLSGQSATAVALGLNATRADPGRAEYWHILGLAHVSASSWRDASAAFNRASALAPHDARFIGDLTAAQLILANTGDRAARTRARELAELAIQVDANNPRAHLTRAVAMQVLGDIPEGLRSAERALALDPGSRNQGLYVTAVQIMLESRRPGDAIRVARQGLAVLGLTNESIATRIELARALVASGQSLDALDELDIALSIRPNDSAVLRLRGEIEAAIPK